MTKTYLDALDTNDGPAIVKELSVPVFVAQGGRDYQVLPEGSYADWQRALAGRPNVTLKLYPALDHLFMAGEDLSYPAEYQKPRNVSGAFIDDVAAWVKAVQP